MKSGTGKQENKKLNIQINCTSGKLTFCAHKWYLSFFFMEKKDADFSGTLSLFSKMRY